MIDDTISEAMKLRLAEHVREVCMQAAREGYQEAAVSGLCGEGALEAALGAIQRLDMASLVNVLDE